MRNIAWLLLAAGAVIYYTEESRKKVLFDWENSLPGLDMALGEYLLIAGAGVLFYTMR